ncbi:glycosyltransferase [Capnocytophaga sp. oral taxon 864]|nr:glycosyltransferase [Capnocytophaga sp. oral taxon 864]
MKKRCVETVRGVRKETEKFGRGEIEFLMEKGCKEGGVSL